MSKRICKFIVSPSRNSALESTHTILRKTSHKIELTEISNLASTRIWLESNEVQRVKIGSRHLPLHRWTNEDKLQLERAKRMAGSFALDSKYWTTNHWCVRYHVFVRVWRAFRYVKFFVSQNKTIVYSDRRLSQGRESWEPYWLQLTKASSQNRFLKFISTSHVPEHARKNSFFIVLQARYIEFHSSQIYIYALG